VIASPSTLPPWRLEVAQRVEAYRERRQHPGAPVAQPSLPFHHQPERVPARPPARATARPLVRPARQERVTIAVRQRELDFSPVADRPDTKKAPVAALASRLRAGSCDALFLLGAYGGFLACFGLLGGQLLFSKLDVAIYLAALALFYGLYFALFTTFGQITPGMRLAGLELAGFDGEEPEARQLLSRSFGYLIAGGAAFLGFLWALWDEDHLTWQDRISQTYLTPARALEPAAEEISSETIEEEPQRTVWRRLVPFQLFGTKRGST
jgi:uncharacterized RDD family membrane protein YckC